MSAVQDTPGARDVSRIQQDKRRLRQVLRARRRALPPWRQRRAAAALARRVVRSAEYRRARSVAAYVAADGEIDPLPVLRHARAAGKQVYLPVLRGGCLVLVRIGPRTRWLRNRYGIPEPRGGRAVALAQVDLLLLPLVGFDARGGRLGMGGGFYDRSLACSTALPVLMGLAHACQEVERLPLAPWDHRLRCVATDRGLFRPATAERRSGRDPGQKRSW